METRVAFEMKVGKRIFKLFIDCVANSSDVTIMGGKYVNLCCVNSSIDEKKSNKDYKKAFEVSQDGDYHILVAFKKEPFQIQVISQYDDLKGPHQLITIKGE